MVCGPVTAFLELTVFVTHRSKLKGKNKVLVWLVGFRSLYSYQLNGYEVDIAERCYE